MNVLFMRMAGVLTLLLVAGCSDQLRDERMQPENNRLQQIDTVDIGNRTHVTLVTVDGVEYVVVHRSWSSTGVAITPHVRRKSAIENHQSQIGNHP